MRNIWTICKKELKSYFTSPVGFVMLALYAFLMGLFFSFMLEQFAFYSQRPQSQGMNVNDMLIRPMLSNLAVVNVFLLPLISMRLFAEEKRQGTIELLLTSPVTDLQVLVGKWLSSALMYAILLAFGSVSMLFLFAYGTPDWRPMAVGYLGIFLQGCAMLAIGTFISSLTKNQIIAAVCTFVICLALWILDWKATFDSSDTAKVMAYLSLNGHMESFSRGTLELKDCIYYVSLTVLGLFLTGRSLESIRWRA